MADSRGRLARTALVALMAVAIGACTTASPGPSTPAPTVGPPQPASPGSTPSTSASPDSSVAPFDVTAVSVSLEPFAKVPGGPLAITAPRDGSGRLFVASQDGRAWVVSSDGSTRSTPLLDIRGRITSGGERGLLGL